MVGNEGLLVSPEMTQKRGLRGMLDGTEYRVTISSNLISPAIAAQCVARNSSVAVRLVRWDANGNVFHAEPLDHTTI